MQVNFFNTFCCPIHALPLGNSFGCFLKFSRVKIRIFLVSKLFWTMVHFVCNLMVNDAISVISLSWFASNDRIGVNLF